jgi:cellulose synthase (UDP-forming)
MEFVLTKMEIDKKRNKWMQNAYLLRLFSVIATAYFIYYLYWRATSTLNPQVLLFSWLLLAAEAFGVMNYLLFAWITLDVSHPSDPGKPRKGTNVDIFVPTYNEELEILEATLIGCCRITYPHITYVLDDGRREEVKQLAESLGCQYLTRPDNKHAKAGNLNHALEKTQGEFVVILDADVVPQPDFLDRTLGYFEDQQLAFVQMPQEFYNDDSIQHDQQEHSWHEQTLFYRVIQPGKNRTNSAFWCGSPSIVRRTALEDVGGVAIETITEDIHTSVRLHSRGWRSLFLNEVLAYGVAPQTIRAFLLQRLRWAQGTMQLYRSHESPLSIPGLTLRQRLSYFLSFLAYFEAFQKLLLISTPTIIILLEIFPMQVSGYIFFIHWFPYFVFTIIANRISGRGYFRYFQTEKFNLLKMVTFLHSFLILLWPKPLKFRVTPKSVEDSVYQRERQAMRVYVGILGFITGIVLYGIIKLLTGLSGQLQLEHFIVALFWATYNGAMVFLGIRDVLTKRHERKQYRFSVCQPAEIYDPVDKSVFSNIQLLDLSISGAGLLLDHNIFLEERELLLQFDTPNHKCMSIPIDQVYYHKTTPDGKMHIGVSFAEMEAIYRERLFEFLFVTLPGYLADRGYEVGDPEQVIETEAAHPITEPQFDEWRLKSNGNLLHR